MSYPQARALVGVLLCGTFLTLALADGGIAAGIAGLPVLAFGVGAGLTISNLVGGESGVLTLITARRWWYFLLAISFAGGLMFLAFGYQLLGLAYLTSGVVIVAMGGVALHLWARLEERKRDGSD